jgi:hypothetical protein
MELRAPGSDAEREDLPAFLKTLHQARPNSARMQCNEWIEMFSVPAVPQAWATSRRIPTIRLQ